MNRREFGRNLGLVSIGALSGLISVSAKTNVNKTGAGFTKKTSFLIISGWQTENIGDIAHTPGLLALIDKYIPDANYYLWPRDIRENGVEEMLKKHFPKLVILKSEIPYEGDVVLTEELKEVFHKCDVLLHGSGPKIFERKRIKLWMEHTQKPYGVCGITQDIGTPEIAEIIEKSNFFFTRETASLKNIQTTIKSPKPIGVFPDATFALSILDDTKALHIINKYGLKDKEFICIVSRLRFTPYHEIRANHNWDQQKIDEVTFINNKYKETDHQKLRTVIINWVRETGKKVLLCPEMTYELKLMDELLINPLPEDVKPNVFKVPEYWITDTAASVYKRAFAVVSMECHSCIIAYANNTPALYIRQKEDTIKGQMYYDLGLSDWVFENDKITGDDVYSELKKLITNYNSGLRIIANTYEIVNTHYKNCFTVIQKF